MEFVVNEWLLDSMCPNADAHRLKMTLQFLNNLVEKCDKVVIRDPSPFVSKFYSHYYNYKYDPECFGRFKKLFELLFINPNKTLIVSDAALGELPPEIERKVPHKDKYLVELAYYSNDKIIITTDNPLKEKLGNCLELKVYLFDEFIKEYLISSES